MNTQRRARQRVYPSARTVAWGPAFGAGLAQATVRDASESGIGLLVAGHVEAAHGEAIRVLSEDHEHARRTRVVRLATERLATGEQTTLGCRRICRRTPGPRDRRVRPGRPETRRHAAHRRARGESHGR